MQKITDEYIVVPIAEEVNNVKGVLRLNETGAILWECLEKGVDSQNEMEKAIASQYGINQGVLHKDIEVFLKKLIDIGCLEME